MSRTRGPQFFPALGTACLLGAAQLGLGCSPASVTTEPAASSAASGAPRAASPPPATPAASAPAITLERAADLTWQAGPVLEGPVARRLQRAELARTQWRRSPGPEPVWLALDQHAPRSLGGTPLRVTQLFNEDEELAPGRHRLVAVKVRADVLVVQTEMFWIDTQEETVAGPGCVLLSPAGTLNGAQAADTSQLLLVPLATTASQIQLSLGGSQLTAELPAQHALAVRLSPIPSGDWPIFVACAFGPAERDKLSRTITVNRELEAVRP